MTKNILHLILLVTLVVKAANLFTPVLAAESDIKEIGTIQDATRNERERCFDAPWTNNFAIVEKDENQLIWKDCEWLDKTNPHLRATYCNTRHDIRRLCPHSCNCCDEKVTCSDAPSSVKFKFDSLNSRAPDEDDMKSCIWLSDLEQARKESFCKRRIDVRRICPMTCAVCDPIHVTDSPNHTERPIDSPTISQSPSTEPTGNPSRQPSTLPSSSPTDCQDNPSFQFHIGFGERQRCEWIARKHYRIHKYCKKEKVKENCRRTCCQCETEGCNTTESPSAEPSVLPSFLPSITPSTNPTSDPSRKPSFQPSVSPSQKPSESPTISQRPTACQDNPSFKFHIAFGKIGERKRCDWIARKHYRIHKYCKKEKVKENCRRTCCQCETEGCKATPSPSVNPSGLPSLKPSDIPSNNPSKEPSMTPSTSPSSEPSGQPSSEPSDSPSSVPSSEPSVVPSSNPSTHPSKEPSMTPSTSPSSEPSGQPSSEPSDSPSTLPSMGPSVLPSSKPSASPSVLPSTSPSMSPSLSPSNFPSNFPSQNPSREPTVRPSFAPTSLPSTKPSIVPSSSMYPSTSPVPTSCHDDYSFRFLISDDPFFHRKRGCKWVSRTASRIQTYCAIEEVFDNCPHTCCACQKDECFHVRDPPPRYHSKKDMKKNYHE